MIHKRTRRSLAAIVSFFLFTTGVGTTSIAADQWPSRPIKFVVAYPSGGGLDAVARIVSEALGQRLKQSVIVDNRPGASGLIGASFAAKSLPDGYTVMIGSPAEMLVSEIAGQRQPFDAQKDFLPVSMIADIPAAIAVSTALPVKSITELIQYAKSGKMLTYGSPGAGGPSHFAGESLNAVSGINMLHIPYKGASPAITDLAGGQIDVAFLGLPAVLPFIKSEKVRLLAVTSKRRSSLAPETPAMVEFSGFTDFIFTNWVGVYVPQGTNSAIITRLNTELAAVVRDPAIQEKFRALGAEAVGDTTEQFTKFMKQERERYEVVAKARKIKFD